jgi:hypothetical protein
MDSPQQALDALQREINLIVSYRNHNCHITHSPDHPQLEQTGRLFAAANQSTPEAALARASRLKQQLPVSNNRFHQALDVLDEKLVGFVGIFASSDKLTDIAILQIGHAP